MLICLLIKASDWAWKLVRILETAILDFSSCLRRGQNWLKLHLLCSTIWSLNNALCDLLEVRSTADERQFSITKWCRRNKESLSCSLVPLLASLQVSRLRRTTGKAYSFAKKPPPLRSRLQLPSTIAMDEIAVNLSADVFWPPILIIASHVFTTLFSKEEQRKKSQ